MIKLNRKTFTAITLAALAGITVTSCTSLNEKGWEALGKVAKTTIQAADAFVPAIVKGIDAATGFTPEQEYYIGRGVASSILTKYDLYEDKAAITYVNNIAQSMILNSKGLGLYKNCTVAILDSDELNGFATSGGHIFITKGLMKSAGSEDALAAVIAHELSHIQNKHSIVAISTGRWKDAFATGIDGAIEFSGVKDELDNYEKLEDLKNMFSGMIDDSANTLMNSGFSQVQEFDADAAALTFMENAGYNVYGMDEMLNMIAASTKKGTTGLFKTHPSPEKRLKAVQTQYNFHEHYDTSPERTQRYNSIVSRM